MRVACIGNMNNMMFSLCRYLRDEKIDAHLFLFDDEASHFLPEADSYDEEHKKYTVTLPVGKHSLSRVNPALLKTAFDGFDFFIGTDIAPALVTLLGKKINVFIPHGSDIYSSPFPGKPEVSADRIWWYREIWFTGLIQKIGVENAGIILFPDEYDTYFPFKHKLRYKGKFYDTSGPMLYAPQYHSSDLSAFESGLRYGRDFKELRRKYRLIVFSHSRQNGINLPDNYKLHEKGNDILIKGFADFVRQNKEIESRLVLFEYGVDVDTSRRLVTTLGIDQQVVWMPKMQRKEIMFGIMNADIACGEFKNSWLTCGVVNETLVLGKPLLHFRDDQTISGDYTELYPLLNARSPEEICVQLTNYIQNERGIIDESKKGLEWIEKYTVQKPLGIILEVLNRGVKAETISFILKLRILMIRFRLSIILGALKLRKRLVHL